MTTIAPHSSEKVVILDRDGVINQDSADYIRNADEWSPIPGSVEAIARLYRSGYKIVVATNQSGLARGYFDEYALANIHSKMCSMVEEAGGLIEGIFFCPHAPDAGCSCRKPGTGLLVQIEHELSCSLAGCIFIGDSSKDLQSAMAHGCKPALVRTGNGATVEADYDGVKQFSIPVFDDLQQAIEQLFFSNHDH